MSEKIYNGEFEYIETDSGIKIVKYIGAAEKVTIPAQIDNKPVIEICKAAFRSNHFIELVNIPNFVTSIGDWTFDDCGSLKSINIPNSVISIGYQAFRGCTSLKSINIPNSVIYFDSCIFIGCTSLKSIDIPNSITKIRHRTFLYCTSLESVNIPDSVTNIEGLAFCDCRSLKFISLPEGIEIGNNAFTSCPAKIVYRPKNIEGSANND